MVFWPSPLVSRGRYIDQIVDEDVYFSCLKCWDDKCHFSGHCMWYDESNRFSSRLTDWSWLRSLPGSQSLQGLIFFAKSATISEKLHQVGGLGDSPNVILKYTKAYAMQVVIVWTMAKALSPGIPELEVLTGSESRGTNRRTADQATYLPNICAFLLRGAHICPTCSAGQMTILANRPAEVDQYWKVLTTYIQRFDDMRLVSYYYCMIGSWLHVPK